MHVLQVAEVAPRVQRGARGGDAEVILDAEVGNNVGQPVEKLALACREGCPNVKRRLQKLEKMLTLFKGVLEQLEKKLQQL